MAGGHPNLTLSEPFLVKILRALLCALLTVVALVAATPGASAAPPTAAYEGSAVGDIARVSLDVAAVDLANIRLANSEATTTNAPAAAVSTSRNLAATVVGLGVGVASNQLTAPPSAGPLTRPLVAASALGISSGALTSINEVDVEGAGNCAATEPAAQTTTTTVGLNVAPAGVVSLLTTGVSSVTTTTGLVSTGGNGLNRAVQSEAVGTLSGVSLLGGAVTVGIVGDATLSATADGTTGGADVDYDAPVVTVSFGTVTETVELGTDFTADLPLVGRVTVAVNQPTTTLDPAGLSASASVSVLTLTIEAGPTALPPVGTATIDLLPLSVSAEAPVGGIDCPPPAPTVTVPADGAVIGDTTPTYTGTGLTGAIIELTVDGQVIDDEIVVDGDGNWTFTQPTPLANGPHTVSATQSVSGVESGSSAVNEFVVDSVVPVAPVITDPDDGDRLADSTPTVTGTGEAGATVTVAVDGEEVGEAVVDGDGNWELPLTEPLAEGERTITAVQTDEAGNTSAADEVTVIVDTEVGLPVITAPADGSVVTDATPTVTGRAEPGASVEISVDGDVVGTVTADGDGNFELPLTEPLAEGDHVVSAVQTDLAGNVSDPASNDFAVDSRAPAAPVITSPEDGATTDDPTPVLEGTGEPGATIVVVVDGEPVGEVVVDEDGNWSFPLPALGDGEHTIEAVAVDEAGNESGVDAIQIVVDTDRAGGGDDGGDGDGDGANGDGGGDGADGGDGPELADTGGPALGYLVVGAVLLLVGGTVLSLTRRRA
jgi:hypothetical protein